MLFEYNTDKRTFEPLTGMAIAESHGGSEKDLEDYLKSVIGDLVFPEYLVFGNERSFQGEPDLFAVSNELFFSQNSGHCWINTCRTHIPDAVFDMVANRKAATYGQRKGAIGGGMKRGNVFLYHNGYGIVAAGIGTATIKDEYNRSLEVDERSIRLSGFVSGVDPVAKQIDASIRPWRIKALLGRDFYFANSLVTLGKEESEKLRSECESEFQGKAQQGSGQ